MREAVHTEEAAEGSRYFGLFLALCVGIGALVGIAARPDTWFDALQKPKFLPPQSVLAAIWLIYFAVMAYVGMRLWRRANARQRWRKSLFAWFVQMLCALAWPIALYKLHNLGLAAVLGLVGAVCAVIITVRVRTRDPVALPGSLLNSGWFCLLAAITLVFAFHNF